MLWVGAPPAAEASRERDTHTLATHLLGHLLKNGIWMGQRRERPLPLARLGKRENQRLRSRVLSKASKRITVQSSFRPRSKPQRLPPGWISARPSLRRSFAWLSGSAALPSATSRLAPAWQKREREREKGRASRSDSRLG